MHAEFYGISEPEERMFPFEVHAFSSAEMFLEFAKE